MVNLEPAFYLLGVLGWAVIATVVFILFILSPIYAYIYDIDPEKQVETFSDFIHRVGSVVLMFYITIAIMAFVFSIYHGMKLVYFVIF